MNTKKAKQKTNQSPIPGLLEQYDLQHTPTVAALRKHGYKVRVNHLRRVIGLDRDDKGNRVFPQYSIDHTDLSPRGGATEVEIIAPSGAVATGRQNCADDDSYCRRIGVAFAIRKALNEAGMKTAETLGGLS